MTFSEWAALASGMTRVQWALARMAWNNAIEEAAKEVLAARGTEIYDPHEVQQFLADKIRLLRS